MPVFDLSANTLGTHDAGLCTVKLVGASEQKLICSSETYYDGANNTYTADGAAQTIDTTALAAVEIY